MSRVLATNGSTPVEPRVKNSG
ncbi:MAG: hypothetical protein K0Q60_4091, partial [Microvirga sp.]|nr:hypothetical protein [Microvirga sp.]